MSVAAAAAGMLLGLTHAQWDAGVLAEGRGSEQVPLELQLEPFVRAETRSRDVAARAAFHPQLIVHDALSRGTFDVLYRGEVAVGWRIDRDVSIAASQVGSIGARSLSWLALAADEPPPADVKNIGGPTVDVLAGRSSIELAARPSRNLVVDGRAGFGISGALHERDFAALPRTKVADAGATATWIERREAFSLVADGSHGWISTGHTTDTVALAGAWRHAFSAVSRRALRRGAIEPRERTPGLRFETELRGGLGAIIGDASQGVRLLPTASFTLLRDAPPRRGAVAARVTLRYAAAIDPTTGAFTPRGELSSVTGVRLERHLVATFSSGIGYTPDPAPMVPRVAAQGELGVTYEIAPGIALSAGTRVARIHDGAEWAGIVRTSLTERGRF